MSLRKSSPILRARRPLSRRETLVGWLFDAARFASAKAVSSDKRRQSLWRKAQQMIERSDNSTSEPAWEEIRPVLDDAIHELNERDREAVLLHFFDRKSFVDMGPTLRITVSGARMRVERALEKLRLSLMSGADLPLTPPGGVRIRLPVNSRWASVVAYLWFKRATPHILRRWFGLN